MINNIMPLLQKYQGTDKLRGIYQYPAEPGKLFEFERWKCYITFVGYKAYNWGDVRKDTWHRTPDPLPDTYDLRAEKARGLIVNPTDNEFYVVGHGFRLLFNGYEPMDGSIPMNFLNQTVQLTNTEYIEVTEGHFDEKGAYVVDRVRSGDESWRGLWCESDCGVIRFTLKDNGTRR